MLDHLSGGRLQLGFGRGVSPIEMEMFGVDPASGQARYLEAYAVIMKVLTSTTLNHEGQFFSFRDVPIHLAPMQRPHPPLWYGVAMPAAATWAAQNRINVISLQPPPNVRAITDRYREEWAAAGNSPLNLPFLGMGRHIVVADTDGEALDIARRAYKLWHANFWHLWVHHNKTNVQPPYNAYPADYDVLLQRGQALAGSPETVRAALASQVEQAGVNYALLDFAFGDLSLAESLRSLDLFARHIMPEFAAA